jgi:hypothetical protein
MVPELAAASTAMLGKAGMLASAESVGVVEAAGDRELVIPDARSEDDEVAEPDGAAVLPERARGAMSATLSSTTASTTASLIARPVPMVRPKTARPFICPSFPPPYLADTVAGTHADEPCD